MGRTVLTQIRDRDNDSKGIERTMLIMLKAFREDFEEDYEITGAQLIELEPHYVQQYGNGAMAYEVTYTHNLIIKFES